MTTNKQIVRAFKAARKYLKTGNLEYTRTSYICGALFEAWRTGDISYTQLETCKDIIRLRLNGVISVDSWLIRHNLIPNTYSPSRNLRKSIQEYRHAWLNSLIKEFSPA